MPGKRDVEALKKLIREVVVQMCRVSCGHSVDIFIDGIICIETLHEDGAEIVIKLHEKLATEEANTSAITPKPRVPPEKEHSVTPLIAHKTMPVISSSAKISSVAESNVVSNELNSSDRGAELKRSQSIASHLGDSDCEILDDTAHKQLLGELVHIAENDLGGWYDFDISDVPVKAEHARITRGSSPAVASGSAVGLTNEFVASTAASTGPYTAAVSSSNNAASLEGKGGAVIASDSDEELKIEKLTAGRVRRPHRPRTAYKDVNGEAVQVVSSEEYARVLKSEKLKRSRDRSPEFVSTRKVFRSIPESQDSPSLTVNHNIASGVVTVSQQPMRTHNVVTLTTTQPDFRTSGSHPMWNIETGNHLTVPSSSVHVIQRYPREDQSSAVEHQTATVDKTNDERSNLLVSTHVQPAESNAVNTTPVIASVTSLMPASDMDTKIAVQSNTTQTLTQQGAETANTSNDPSCVCLDTVSVNKYRKCPLNQCSESFYTFKELDKHMSRVHGGSYLCPLCQKLFRQRGSRNRHIVAVHSQVKNFYCSLCEMAFTRIDSVQKHFLSQHPGNPLPSFSYSYKRGHALSRGSDSQLENSSHIFKQELPWVDIAYIEEQLLGGTLSHALTSTANTQVQGLFPMLENTTDSQADFNSQSEEVIYVDDSDIQIAGIVEGNHLLAGIGDVNAYSSHLVETTMVQEESNRDPISTTHGMQSMPASNVQTVAVSTPNSAKMVAISSASDLKVLEAQSNVSIGDSVGSVCVVASSSKEPQLSITQAVLFSLGGSSSVISNIATQANGSQQSVSGIVRANSVSKEIVKMAALSSHANVYLPQTVKTNTETDLPQRLHSEKPSTPVVTTAAASKSSVDNDNMVHNLGQSTMANIHNVAVAVILSANSNSNLETVQHLQSIEPPVRVRNTEASYKHKLVSQILARARAKSGAEKHTQLAKTTRHSKSISVKDRISRSANIGRTKQSTIEKPGNQTKRSDDTGNSSEVSVSVDLNRSVGQDNYLIRETTSLSQESNLDVIGSNVTVADSSSNTVEYGSDIYNQDANLIQMVHQETEQYNATAQPHNLTATNTEKDCKESERFEHEKCASHTYTAEHTCQETTPAGSAVAAATHELSICSIEISDEESDSNNTNN